MLTFLKFSTENKFFQCDVINIPGFNVLQRKIPVQIVWICSGSWKQGTSPAFSVILSYFLVIVLILSITGRGAPVYLPTTRGQTFQSATNTGEMSLWAQWNKRSRPREGAERAGQGCAGTAWLGQGCWAAGTASAAWRGSEPGNSGGRAKGCAVPGWFDSERGSSHSVSEGRIWSRLLPLSGALNSAASSWYRNSQGRAIHSTVKLIRLMQTLNKCP